MKHLHLHIISQDFDSLSLKNKKHWNSFTTKFFLDAEAVLGELKKNGSVTVDKSRGEAYLKEDLRCHVCHTSLANISEIEGPYQGTRQGSS